MAQTGYTPILIYSSSTAAAAPAAGSLTNSTLGSELAINITDGKLFYKDNANAVQVIGWKTVPTSAGGTGLTSYTAGDLIYYASGTAFTKLGIGSNTTVLTSSGTAPQWTAQSALSVGTASNLLSNATTGVMQITGPAAGTTRVMTIPNANFTAARTDAAQTFTGNQTFSNGDITLSTANKGYYFFSSNRQYFLYGDGADNLRFVRYSTGGSFQDVPFEIDVNSNVKVPTGNLVIGTSGKGIDFSANSHAAGMTSELLTWYEEGTWTPVVTSGGGTITSYTSAGNYTRVGNVLTIFMRTKITNPGTASGNLNFSGLPFTAKTVGIAYITSVTARENNLTGANYSALIAQSATTGLIVNPSWTTNVEYLFSATYLL